MKKDKIKDIKDDIIFYCNKYKLDIPENWSLDEIKEIREMINYCIYLDENAK